jgi:hypothetical protein
MSTCPVNVDGVYCALPAKLAVNACCPSVKPLVEELGNINSPVPLVDVVACSAYVPST